MIIQIVDLFDVMESEFIQSLDTYLFRGSN